MNPTIFVKNAKMAKMATGVYRHLLRKSYCRISRTYSSNVKRVNEVDDPVVITDDGSTIVCWHPEKPFPYEMSRPIPERSAAHDDVLKIQSSIALKSIFKPKPVEVVRQELMSITYTTKHKWFFGYEKHKKKPPPPANRPYL